MMEDDKSMRHEFCEALIHEGMECVNKTIGEALLPWINEPHEHMAIYGIAMVTLAEDQEGIHIATVVTPADQGELWDAALRHAAAIIRENAPDIPDKGEVH